MGVVSQPGYPDAPLPYEEIKAGAGSQVARYLNHEGPPPRGEPPPKEKEDARQAGEVGAAAPPTDVDTTGSSPEIDAQAATTAEDWTQNPYVQIEGGFLAGVSLGLVPMGGVGQQLADAGEVLPHGTPEARLGLSVGMIVGGIAITAGGMAGGLLGGATTATGAGAPVGVPAMVVSTTLVVGGAGNIAAGIRGLTQAMMSEGSGNSAASKPPYKINPARDPRTGRINPTKTPEPSDAASVYERSILGSDGKWYGQNSKGDIYRYHSDNAGTFHFSGSTGGPKPVPKEHIPIDVRRALGW
jgi:hypothetical protein